MEMVTPVGMQMTYANSSNVSQVHQNLNNAIALQQDIETDRQKKDDELKNSQLAKEKEFFAENAKKPGVKVTESGLQYKVVKEGSGKTPTDSSDVKIHYEGKLLDGTVFDSSYDSEEPTSLNMGFLIPGMVEGLKLMKEGAQYVFYIPQDLGYGEYSPGETLPAYSTLIFEIELISVDEPSEEQE